MEAKPEGTWLALVQHYKSFCINVMYWRRKWQPTPVFSLENPVDRGAWWAAVHKIAQSQTRLKWLSMHACIGEGNGNPLQYSCLENPRDRGAWWAVVYGVTHGRTWLKWLSSSSITIRQFRLQMWEYMNVFCNEWSGMYLTSYESPLK